MSPPKDSPLPEASEDTHNTTQYGSFPIDLFWAFNCDVKWLKSAAQDVRVKDRLVRLLQPLHSLPYLSIIGSFEPSLHAHESFQRFSNCLPVKSWNHRRGQFETFRQVLKYFENPWLIIALRLGLVTSPYFLYRFRGPAGQYSMMARPSRSSMADLFVLREVLIAEAYKEILPLLDRRPIRFVDVGGNIGTFAVWLSRRCVIREGWIFEPLSDSRKLLEFNLANQNVQNVEVVAAALGGQTRRIRMALNDESPGGSSIYGSTGSEKAEEVTVLAFSQWVAQIDGELDLLKLDCEGAEWEILENTPKGLFQRFRVVVAEVHSISAQADVFRFKEFFEAAGFRTIRWDGCSHGLYVGLRATA